MKSVRVKLGKLGNRSFCLQKQRPVSSIAEDFRPVEISGEPTGVALHQRDARVDHACVRRADCRVSAALGGSERNALGFHHFEGCVHVA